MSHYTEIKTSFTSKEYLIKALIESGFSPNTIEDHESPVSLFYDHSKTANIIIRKEQVGSFSDDIGFVRTPEGTYQAIIGESDQRYPGFNNLSKDCGGYNERFLGRLTASYAIIAAKTELEKKGCKVEVVTRNGKTVVIGKSDVKAKAKMFSKKAANKLAELFA